MLVSTGSVARECRLQLPLIDLLCDYGADPNSANTSGGLARRARGSERFDQAWRSNRFAGGSGPAAHRRCPSAACGAPAVRTAIWLSLWQRILVMSRSFDVARRGRRSKPYNPVEAIPTRHRCTKLPGRHDEVVRLLVERGARLDLKDVLWRATPADWARHAGRTEIEAYLRRQMGSDKGTFGDE